jgi:exodeoxyribonuclease VII small subunit
MKKSELSYRELREKLDAVMQWFESESLDVDEALAKHQEATQLLDQLDTYLEQAKQKVTKVK